MDMNKYIEVFQRIIEMTETLREAVDSLHEHFEQNRPEEFLLVNEDMIAVVDSIQGAIESVQHELKENTISDHSWEFKNILVRLNLNLTMEEYDEVRQVLKEDINKIFTSWKTEIERILKPLIIN